MAAVSQAELGRGLQIIDQVGHERSISHEQLYNKVLLLWRVLQPHRQPSIERSAGMQMHYIEEKKDSDEKSLGMRVLDSILKSYLDPNTPEKNQSFSATLSINPGYTDYDPYINPKKLASPESIRLSFAGPWPSEFEPAVTSSFRRHKLLPISDRAPIVLEIREIPRNDLKPYILVISGENPHRRVGYLPLAHELVDVDQQNAIAQWKRMKLYLEHVSGTQYVFLTPQGNVAIKRLIAADILDKLYEVARGSKGSDIDELNKRIQEQGMGEDGSIEPLSIAQDVVYGYPTA